METLSYTLAFIALIIFIIGILGIIHPRLAKCSSRKNSFKLLIAPAFCIFLAAVFILPESAIEQTPPTAFDINKIFLKTEQDVTHYLGSPITCYDNKINDVVGKKCEYQHLNIELTFMNGLADWISINELSNLDFSLDSIKHIGVKTDEKPDNHNAYGIRWNYLNGRSVSIFPNKQGNIKYIHVVSAPWSTDYTGDANLSARQVISFMLEALHKNLSHRGTYKPATLNLYMDGLISKYGQEVEPKFIHRFKLSSQDVEEILRYKDSAMFHLTKNEQFQKFYLELAQQQHPLFMKFWKIQ